MELLISSIPSSQWLLIPESPFGAYIHCFPTMRTVIHPISIHAASSPIETIVFFFFLATLLYFHVLSAVKHSSLFAPSTLSPLCPSHVLLHGNKWVAVAEPEYDALVCWPNCVSVIDLQQLSMSFDGRTAKEVHENLSPSFCTCWPFHDKMRKEPKSLWTKLPRARCAIHSALSHDTNNLQLI